MSQDTKLQQLVINKLTTAQYNAAVEAGTIDDNQLYMTTDAVTVDDVKVNGTSVVTNNTANLTLGTMAQETASDYSKKSVADTLYAAKSLETTVSTHLSASNPHNITKSTIGLGNVDNTSDANKPVSTAQQTALNGKVDKINTANKIYGTDSSGVQTTYDITSFGLVDDVKVGTTSVVSNKIATLGTMAGENTSTYYTKTEVDGLVGSVYKPAGSKVFISLPTPSETNLGNVYNVTNSFTTNNKFVEGSGKTYPAGTNVVVIDIGSNLYAWVCVDSTIAPETMIGTYTYTKEIPEIGSSVRTCGRDGNYTDMGTLYRDSETVATSSGFGFTYTYNRDSSNDVSRYLFDVLAGMVDLSGYVPTSRTINGKALTSNITLSASDVNALPSSTVIPTVNNATLTITQGGVSKGTFTANASSNVTIALDSGHDIDNKSITKNSSDEIQTFGVINQNATTTAIKTWSGTLAEYNSLESHSNDCLYYITDDLQDGSVTGGADDRFTRGISKVFPSTMYDYDNTTHTLTLKAGSKVFYPDGKNASDVLQIHEGTINSDITYTPSDMSGNPEYIVYNITQERLEHIPVQSTRTTTDGTTDVSPCIAYNNTTNYIKKSTDTGSTWSTDIYSFPIMLVIPSSGQIQHINKVFNSCSCIGTTAFFRAGYTLRFPNGFDKNTNLPTFLEEPLRVHRLCEMGGSYSLYVELDTDDTDNQYVSQCNNALVYQQEQMPMYRNTELWYNPDANFWFYTTDGGSTWQKCYLCFLTNQNHISSGYINSFNPIGPATVLTTNDMRLINHWNFPSNWRTNITPTNGGLYTAPGEGWFYLAVTRADNTTDAYASITGYETGYCVTSSCPSLDENSSSKAAVIMPVSTGTSVIMNFTGTVNACGFYYANGSYIVW